MRAELLVNVELKAAARGRWTPARAGRPRRRRSSRRTGAGRPRAGLVLHPRAVRLWMRRSPAVPAALLFERAAPLPLRRAWAASWLHPAALTPSPRCARRRAWRAGTRLGYAVNVWTVDDAAAVRACRDLGVDGDHHERSGPHAPAPRG